MRRVEVLQMEKFVMTFFLGLLRGFGGVLLVLLLIMIPLGFVSADDPTPTPVIFCDNSCSTTCAGVGACVLGGCNGKTWGDLIPCQRCYCWDDPATGQCRCF